MSEHESARDPEPAAPAPRLTFEAWADLSARLLDLDEDARLDILDAREIDPDEWMLCDQHYALALADDVAHGRMARAESYGRRCAAELAQRATAAGSSAPSNGATPPAGSDGVPMKIGAPMEPPQAAVATFQRPGYVTPPAAPPQDEATTAAVFALPTALRDGALPFNKNAASSLPAAPADTKPLPPAETPGGTQVLGETRVLDPHSPAQLQAALPFAGREAPAAPAFPRLPLQTYASLCAELSVFPDQTEAIRKQNGIAGAEAQAALDQLWRTRLDADAGVRAEWEALVAHFREWFQQRPR